MFKKMLFTLITAVLIVGLLVGCGAGGETGGGVPEDAALTVTGMVDSDVGWTADELQGMETMDVEVENKEGGMDAYTGVSINALLEEASVQGDASMVELIASDGYSVEVDLGEIQACDNCIVAFDDDSFRSVLPGFPRNTGVKGLVEINVK